MGQLKVWADISGILLANRIHPRKLPVNVANIRRVCNDDTSSSEQQEQLDGRGSFRPHRNFEMSFQKPLLAWPDMSSVDSQMSYWWNRKKDVRHMATLALSVCNPFFVNPRSKILTLQRSLTEPWMGLGSRRARIE